MNYPSTFELPTTDPLTGFLTAPYFRHLLRQELLPRSAQNDEPLSILLTDLDGFYQINEEHGHALGNTIVSEVTRVVRDTCPSSAVLCRYGGDELAVALPDCRMDDAFTIAEAVRREIESLAFPELPGVRLTCSIGLAAYPAHGRDEVELMREADQAQYTAKVTGRNKVSLPLVDSRMVTKTSHYTQTQLERLANLARQLKRNEASLLREALDDLLKKHNDRAEVLAS